MGHVPQCLLLAFGHQTPEHFHILVVVTNVCIQAIVVGDEMYQHLTLLIRQAIQ